MEIQYIQGAELMKEKIENCMKRKCNECKYYDYCFGYKNKTNKSQSNTISKHLQQYKKSE